MTVIVSPSMRTPWMAACVVLFLFWTLWSLDITSVKSVVETTIYEDTSVQTDDSTVEFAPEAITISEPAALPVVTTKTTFIPAPLSTQAAFNPKTWSISEPPVEEPSHTDVEHSKEAADTDNISSISSSPNPSTITETPVEEPSVTDLHPSQEEADIGSGTSISSSPKSSSSIMVQSPAAGAVAVPENPHVVSERPLILYAYSETVSARINLEFFITHGLHANADFVFILNGPTDAPDIIPQEPNIRYIQRPNDCYDLGAYAEVLIKDDLYKRYKHFIMLNASIRGPFLPYWAEGCWSDMYLKRVTDEVKLVGMTANCWPSFHVQSMIWATDITGLSLLLFPSDSVTSALKAEIRQSSPFDPDELEPSTSGINSCFHTWRTAVAAEIGASALIKAAGYKLDVMMSAFHSKQNDGDRYELECDGSENGDVLWDKEYYGTNVHPYETIFLKSNRDIDPVGLERLTEWTRGRGYSSYQYCIAESPNLGGSGTL